MDPNAEEMLTFEPIAERKEMLLPEGRYDVEVTDLRPARTKKNNVPYYQMFFRVVPGNWTPTITEPDDLDYTGVEVPCFNPRMNADLLVATGYAAREGNRLVYAPNLRDSEGRLNLQKSAFLGYRLAVDVTHSNWRDDGKTTMDVVGIYDPDTAPPLPQPEPDVIVNGTNLSKGGDIGF